jgi:hemerythrin-like metal-binding protein
VRLTFIIQYQNFVSKTLLTLAFAGRIVSIRELPFMNSIPIWHTDLCVRNPELDAQHITLMEICRELLCAIEFRPNCPEPVLVLLRDIAAVTRQHHKMEEAVLKANDCPTLMAIAVAHSEAQSMLDGMVAEAMQQSADHEVMVRKIADWNHSHLYETDLPVRAFLRG